MTNPVWDMDMTLQDFRKILKSGADKRFTFCLARVLSRVPFREVFRHYITFQQFQKNYKKVRRLMRSDTLGAGRIEFWDWLYHRI